MAYQIKNMNLNLFFMLRFLTKNLPLITIIKKFTSLKNIVLPYFMMCGGFTCSKNALAFLNILYLVSVIKQRGCFSPSQVD